MARIAYVDQNAPDIAPLAGRITAERGKVLNLYRMLLHSPPIAEGWLKLFTAIRQQGTLNGRIRELVILRIAVINRADYEFGQHVPFALKEGITQPQIDALRDGETTAFDDPADRVALAYADSMTCDVHVPDAVFDALQPHFDERGIVELTATIAGYNLVSRFLEALQIDPE